MPLPRCVLSLAPASAAFQDRRTVRGGVAQGDGDVRPRLPV